MKRTMVLVVAALAAAAPLAVTSAGAQVPRYGAYGDRDRDGIPNAYDRRDNSNQSRYYNRYGAWGDRDRDGVPNIADRFDNRGLRDKDRDGVPQAWDRNDRNPWRY